VRVAKGFAPFYHPISSGFSQEKDQNSIPLLPSSPDFFLTNSGTECVVFLFYFSFFTRESWALANINIWLNIYLINHIGYYYMLVVLLEAGNETMNKTDVKTKTKQM
jgi:hypothetical protein